MNEFNSEDEVEKIKKKLNLSEEQIAEILYGWYSDLLKALKKATYKGS